MSLKKIYLAIPYSGMKESSYKQATLATIKIIQSFEGVNVFSPITHSHPLHVMSDGQIPSDWEYWQQVDFQYIDWVDEVWVFIPREGSKMVKASVGVQAEIAYAEKIGKPIKVCYFLYDTALGSKKTEVFRVEEKEPPKPEK